MAAFGLVEPLRSEIPYVEQRWTTCANTNSYRLVSRDISSRRIISFSESCILLKSEEPTSLLIDQIHTHTLSSCGMSIDRTVAALYPILASNTFLIIYGSEFMLRRVVQSQ